MADAKMPFLSHLEELRTRLIRSFVAIGLGFLLTFNFSEPILGFLKKPLTTNLVFQRIPPFLTWAQRTQSFELVFLAPAEAFWMHLKIAFFSGLLLAFPFVLYEIWKFVEPGLLSHEKRFALPFLILGSLCFFFGLLFCFYVVLPFALNFLLTYKTQHLKPMISIGNYVDFTVKFLLAFGLVFELPLAIGIAARMNLVTSQFLARNRKYAILINFALAAILTPTPDVFNQTLMALPMCLLYEIGILAAKVVARRKKPVVEEATGEA